MRGFFTRSIAEDSAGYAQREALQQRAMSHHVKVTEAYKNLNTNLNIVKSEKAKVPAIIEAANRSLKTDCFGDEQQNERLNAIESFLEEWLKGYEAKVMAAQESYDVYCSLLQESSTFSNSKASSNINKMLSAENRNLKSDFYIPVARQVRQHIANMKKIDGGNEAAVSQKQISRNAF